MPTTSSTYIDIKLDPALKKQIAVIKETYLTNFTIKDEELTVKDLALEFKVLNSLSNLKQEEKLAIAKYTLAVMHAVNDHLQFPTPKNNKPVEKKKNKSRWFVFFGVLILFQAIPMLLIGYFGMGELLVDLIPGIPDTLLQIMSALFAAVECILEAVGSIILIKLGFAPNEPWKSNDLLDTYNQQFTIFKDISKYLTRPFRSRELSSKADFIDLATQFNLSLTNIENLPFHEARAKKIVRHTVNIISNASLIGGGLYLTNTTLIAMISPALVFTPVGWAIAAAVVICMLLIRHWTKSNNLYELFNPEVEQYKKLENNITELRGEGLEAEFNFSKSQITTQTKTAVTVPIATNSVNTALIDTLSTLSAKHGIYTSSPITPSIIPDTSAIPITSPTA